MKVFSFLILLFLAAPGMVWAQSFPEVHEEPITVRVLDGAGGEPLAFAHVRVVAGYDSGDLKKQMWREDVLTDATGAVRLPRGLANFPWLRGWVEKAKPCQADGDGPGFSMERIRKEGLASSNRCGVATAEERAGVLAVFVQGKQYALPKKAEVPAPLQGAGDSSKGR